MIKLTVTEIEDLILPERLYKFRNWSIPEHRKILTHQEVYFAPHNTFGEHHEHNLPQDYESITPGILFSYFYKNAESRFGPSSHEEKEDFAKYWVKNTPFHCPRHRQEVEERFQATLNRRKGILSMSPERDNKNLWANFAHENRGFAVGFNPKFMFEKEVIIGSAGYVNYYEANNTPKVRPICCNDMERVEDMMKTIFNLPIIFEDEKEYRLSKEIKNGVRNFEYCNECLEEVLLGANMNPKVQGEIIQVVKDKYPHALILKQSIDYDSDVFTYNQI